jgi:hypothetical protein
MVFIYRMEDGTRFRVTAMEPTEDGKGRREFESYRFDQDGAKIPLGTEVLVEPEATRRMNQLTLADGLRLIKEMGIKYP